MIKKFNFIELLIVATIIVFLTSIAIIAIGNMETETNNVKTKADIKAIQNSVNLYSIKTKGKYPTRYQPTTIVPQPIDFEKIKDIIEQKKIPTKYKYWVDFKGNVWYSLIDAPTNISFNNSTHQLTWSPVTDAISYDIYELITTINEEGKLILENDYNFIANVPQSLNPIFNGEASKTYVVSSVDIEGNKTPPTGKGYLGYTNSTEGTEVEIPNQPPIAIITMTPDTNITTDTIIDWGYENSTDPDGDSIIEIQWQLDTNPTTNSPNGAISVTGNHIMKLRVRDSRDLWSSWVEKSFTVSDNKQVTQIAVGNMFTVALLKDGTVKSWGENIVGQLGDGTNTDKNTPSTISISGVKQIATGLNHTIALMSDGTVMTWGDNLDGQLGNGTTIDEYSPISVPDLTNVKQIEAGDTFSIALLNDGTVKAWGNNEWGTLGDNTITDRYSPITVPNLNNVKEISTSGNFVMALLNDGTVKAWGANNYGQLGDNKVSSGRTPILIPNLNNVVQISAGQDHTLVLLNDGTVKGWGNNINGVLGDGTLIGKYIPTILSNLTNVQKTFACANSSFVTLNDGTVKAWGDNTEGKLGNGTTTIQKTPVIISSLANINQITCSSSHTGSIATNGMTYVWGDNFYGQIGDGTNTSSITPVIVEVSQ